MLCKTLFAILPLLALTAASPVAKPEDGAGLIARDPGLLDGLGLGGGSTAGGNKSGTSSGAGATTAGALDGADGVLENLGLGGAGGAAGGSDPLSGLLGGL